MLYAVWTRHRVWMRQVLLCASRVFLWTRHCISVP